MTPTKEKRTESGNTKQAQPPEAARRRAAPEDGAARVEIATRRKGIRRKRRTGIGTGVVETEIKKRRGASEGRGVVGAVAKDGVEGRRTEVSDPEVKAVIKSVAGIEIRKESIGSGGVRAVNGRGHGRHVLVEANADEASRLLVR